MSAWPHLRCAFEGLAARAGRDNHTAQQQTLLHKCNKNDCTSDSVDNATANIGSQSHIDTVGT